MLVIEYKLLVQEHSNFHEFPHLQTETTFLDTDLNLLVPGDPWDGAQVHAGTLHRLNGSDLGEEVLSLM